MKLSCIKVQQFRRFDQAVELNQLQAGLNIVAGPNEAGKSTLAQAIRTAFFERHTTGNGPKALGKILPWGDSSAAPEIELQFAVDGQAYHLYKRFFKAKRCYLDFASQRLEGEQAEQYLAQLLGYDYASRGASDSKNWGIPGLLWIEQGQGQELREAVQAANTSLQQALGQHVTELSSTDGEGLLELVRLELGQLLTGVHAQPKGEWAASIKLANQAQQQLQEWFEQLCQYQQWVDELTRLQAEVRRFEADKPWLEMQKQYEQAQQKLKQAQALERNLEQLGQQLKLVLLELERQQEWLQAQHEREQSLRDKQASLAELHTRLPQIRQRHDALLQQFQAVAQERDRYEIYKEQARQLQIWHLQKKSHEHAGQELQRMLEVCAKAQALDQRISQLSVRCEQESVDAKVIEQLRALQARTQSQQISLQAQAPQLEFDLREGVALYLDDKPIQGRGSCVLSRTLTLSLGAQGQLRFVPPQDSALQELSRAIEQQCQQQSQLLERHAADSLEQLEQRWRDKQEWMAELKHDKAVLQSYAPDGVSALQARIQSLRQMQQALPARPEVGESPEVDLRDPDELLRQFESLKNRAALLERERLPVQEQMQKTQASIESLEHELALQARQRQEDSYQEQLQTRLAQAGKLSLQEQALRSQIEQVQERYREAGADLLAQDSERYQRSAEQLRVQYEQAREQRLVMQTRLESAGAQGLEEKIETQKGLLERLERRNAQYARRARALELLLATLLEKKRALTDSLQQPLRARLLHYLRFLPGCSALELDDSLTPVGLQRRSHLGMPDVVQDLSFGTREQLGLIARLAYADLLQQAGRPTLLMLDDVLMHSDGDRLDHMKRMLHDAAGRHQILLFTCQPEKWRDMGVPIQHLP